MNNNNFTIQQAQQSNGLRAANGFVYTYHLPYGIRRDICNLLDADQSWRELGGHFGKLDATQLTLIGQAYFRNCSPTEELLNKFDSANLRIIDLCYYLKQMSHWRALEILKGFYVINNNEDFNDIQGNANNGQTHPFATGDNGAGGTSISSLMQINTSTLYTPTPSFVNIPPVAALMDVPGYHHHHHHQDLIGGDAAESWPNVAQTEGRPPAGQPAQDPVSGHQQVNEGTGKEQQNQNPPPPAECHQQRRNEAPAPQVPARQVPVEAGTGAAAAAAAAADAPGDPGEEIVRMACANNRKRTSISNQEVVNQLRLIMQITYNELKQASNDFSDANILGNGGFASVYRGHWKGTDVAIKRLRCNLMDQALNELTILNSYRIDNILPIYGISIDGPEACLVYQFMANGSLEERLSCKNQSLPLSWQQRALIGEGVAKGLYYLHTLRDKPLVHGDVKSANVLLDAQFVPKLGDFGLARQVFNKRSSQQRTELCTHCTVSSIHGTSVYLPPEYLRHKILSPAVDVYSYGIVLLEMATGRRAFDGRRLLIDLVEDEWASSSSETAGSGSPSLCNKQQRLERSIRDPRLNTMDTSSEGLRIWRELLLELGINCANKIKKKRPDMGKVLSHFANFRLGSPEDSGSLANRLGVFDSGNPRTSTPDVALFNGLEAVNNDESGQRNNGYNDHPQQNHQQQQQQVDQALMSVEEEEALHYQEQLQAQTKQNHQHNVGNLPEDPAPAVEAMIPLLTELGISAQQD